MRIAKELTARGYLPRRGTSRGMHWSEDSVKYMIRNPIYKGVLAYEDIEHEGSIPAIIDDELWTSAQAPRSIPNRAQQSPHLLTGLLYCEYCRHGAWTTVKNGRVYTDRNGKRHERVTRYMCRTKRDHHAGACESLLLDKVSLEKRIVDEIFRLADSKKIVKELVRARNNTTPDNVNQELARVRKEREALQGLMAELFADYYDHRLITREQFAQKNAEYLEREKLLEGKIGDLERISPARQEEELSVWLAGARGLKDRWNLLTEQEKRLALRQVVKRIDISPASVTANFFCLKKEIAPVAITGAAMIF